MSLRQRVSVHQCPLNDIKELMERVHYAHSVFGVTVSKCFKVLLDGGLVGGGIFGLPAGAGVKEKYAEGGHLLELKTIRIDRRYTQEH